MFVLEIWSLSLTDWITKFFILRGFVCLFIFTGMGVGERIINSLGVNIVIPDVYGPLAVTHPQQYLTSSQCWPLCLRPAVSPSTGRIRCGLAPGPLSWFWSAGSHVPAALDEVQSPPEGGLLSASTPSASSLIRPPSKFISSKLFRTPVCVYFCF